jgi:NitT/TauT family transport system substrate-binding protein
MVRRQQRGWRAIVQPVSITRPSFRFRQLFRSPLATGLGAALIAFGCAGPPAAPTGAPTAAPPPAAAPKALEKVSLRLDFLPTGYHAAFYVAIDKGFYQESGLDVTVGSGTGSATTVQQVAAGQDTFGLASSDRIIVAAAQGAPVVAVAGPIQESGACYVALADSGIRTFRDLEGRSVGDTPGGFTLNLMPQVFKSAGVDASKVNVVLVEASVLRPTLLERKVDAIATVCGDSSIKLEATGAKLNMMRFADAGVATLGPSIFTNTKTLQEMPNVVREFVQASLKGWQYMLEQPDDAAAIIKKLNQDAPETSVSIQIIREASTRAFTDNSQGKPLGWMADKDWKATGDLLAQYADLKDKAAFDVSKFFTNQFIPGT